LRDEQLQSQLVPVELLVQPSYFTIRRCGRPRRASWIQAIEKAARVGSLGRQQGVEKNTKLMLKTATSNDLMLFDAMIYL
jgi:hypothetical protein